MGPSATTSHVIGSKQVLDFTDPFKESMLVKPTVHVDQTVENDSVHPVKGDLSAIVEPSDLSTSLSEISPSHQVAVNSLVKDALKRPVRVVGMSQASGLGISESVTLKQALRRLCISHASEMAVTKRLSKTTGLPAVSEAGTIKRLYAAIVVQVSETSDQEKGNLLEISLVSEKPTSESSEEVAGSFQMLNTKSFNEIVICSPHGTAATAAMVTKARVLDKIAPGSAEAASKLSVGTQAEMQGKVEPEKLAFSANTDCKISKSSLGPRPTNPVSKIRSISNRKGKQNSSSTTGSSRRTKDTEGNGTGTENERCRKESACSASSTTNTSAASSLRNKDSSKPGSTPRSCNGCKGVAAKMRKSPRSREKGECFESSNGSSGNHSSSGTSISKESNLSGSSGFGSKPHMSKDVRWLAIHKVEMQHGNIELKNFNLLKRLGCGDIGTVYLAELIGTECLFALKVMDVEFLLSRKKMMRAQTEREILQMLDHPFLPTLYTYFTTDDLLCLVMEYCPSGDLHVLRQKQPGKNFSEQAARFYVAEVLLALEYLHMLGVVYRDLKPENILVREDGHIMLSDFDLSLQCSVNPTLLRSSSLCMAEVSNKLVGPCAAGCINPPCLQPSWVHSKCFMPRPVSKTRKFKSDPPVLVNPLPQLVVEPTEARSNSFVGTHEYLAPEIIKGEGHGSSVDWWTFGIFLYELLFGRTPFKGAGNEETLANIISENLMFPDGPVVSFHALDLIRGLLVKEPAKRLGSARGAAEIKQHPFFKGLNWALIRCTSPPETPRPYAFGIPVDVPKKKEARCLPFRSNGEGVEFELF